MVVRECTDVRSFWRPFFPTSLSFRSSRMAPCELERNESEVTSLCGEAILTEGAVSSALSSAPCSPAILEQVA